jgi:anti-sigma regulatory factor (Ser/Thr protein kinase)
VLRSWGLEGIAAAAELIASELVTNAVAASAAAGHPVVRLRVTCRPWSLLVAVWDGAPGRPEPRQDNPAEAPGGRGLVLVAAFADSWGYDLADGGKFVYAEISR